MMNEELKKSTIKKMMKEPKKLTNGLITIGFDISKDKDHCCLVVGQLRGKSEIMIIKELYDDDANNLYKQIIS